MATALRAELPLAGALPLELLRPLTEVLPSGDADLARAEETFLSHLSRHREFLESIDYPRTRAELVALNRRDYEGFGVKEARRASRLAWQVDSYETTYGFLSDSFFSLVALRFVASGILREEILEFLRGRSWSTKHEVLTRWGWMLEHRRLLQEGRARIEDPYSCTVPRRGSDSRNVDREFYQLLHFLHWLRITAGQEFLFHQKGQTPDFILEDMAGQPLGAEMTEASVSDAWDRERDAEEKVLNLIRNNAGQLPLLLVVREPASWLPVAENLGDLELWMVAKLQQTDLGARATLENADLGIVFDISPSPTEGFGLVIENLTPGTGDKVERETRSLQETLRQRIENKIERIKEGRRAARRLPSIRPCWLVVYPNYDLGQNLEQAVQNFFEHSPIDVSSHFDAVWLSGERALVQLS